jgi:hypothetical protein
MDTGDSTAGTVGKRMRCEALTRLAAEKSTPWHDWTTPPVSRLESTQQLADLCARGSLGSAVVGLLTSNCDDRLPEISRQ